MAKLDLSRATSSPGVRPNSRLNSRLNCEALSYPTSLLAARGRRRRLVAQHQQARPVQANGLQILHRGAVGHRPEVRVEGRDAHAGLVGQSFDRQAIVEGGVDPPDRLGDLSELPAACERGPHRRALLAAQHAEVDLADECRPEQGRLGHGAHAFQQSKDGRREPVVHRSGHHARRRRRWRADQFVELQGEGAHDGEIESQIDRQQRLFFRCIGLHRERYGTETAR